MTPDLAALLESRRPEPACERPEDRARRLAVEGELRAGLVAIFERLSGAPIPGTALMPLRLSQPLEWWRTVPGMRWLRVSNWGRILSTRMRWSRRPCRPRLVEPHCTDGYLRITEGAVQRLVLLPFCGEPPPGRPCGLHRNDLKADNRLINLRWGSYRDNARDCLRNGNGPRVGMRKRKSNDSD